MKIYDTEGLPNPARVRIALAEKGALDQIQFVPVDVTNGEHRTEAFRAKNPEAAVPCLELDDGTYLSRCTAITEYIDATLPGPSLCGDTPRDRGVISMMNLRAEGELLDALADYFHHATPGLGPDLETDQNAEWGRRRKKTTLATMEYLDNVLARDDYLAGDTFSIADITAYAGLAFADFAKIEIPATLSNLIEWRARVAQRPSIAA